MRAGIMFSEVMAGLRRNVTMTIAMILTTAISLGMLGGGLIIARMTDQMKQIFGNKVEVTVYLTTAQSQADPNCTADLCADLLKELEANPEVASARYESQQQALERYNEMFAAAARAARHRVRGRAAGVVPRHAEQPGELPDDHHRATPGGPASTPSRTRARSWIGCSRCSTACATPRSRSPSCRRSPRSC